MMAGIYDNHSRDELLAEILLLRNKVAANANTCIRYEIALKLARQFGIASRGFDGGVSVMLADWFDADRKEGVPWPPGVFARTWLTKSGYSEVNGKVGMRATMTFAEPDAKH